jgi:hypothetical protein
MFAVAILAIAVLVLVVVWSAASGAGGPGDAGEGAVPAVVLVVLAAVLVALFLFHSMTVEVSRERIRIAFGPGVVRRTIRATDVRAARRVRNHWYYGWGIRLTPHGWLYSVSGLEGIELVLGDGRRVRIGSDDSDGLLRAIDALVLGGPASGIRPEEE